MSKNKVKLHRVSLGSFETPNKIQECFKGRQ